MVGRPFKQVDVFTATRYGGNPVAVVLDGSGLSSEAMQHFTDWTNLSEATFLLPPTDPRADYRLRIFCPGRELPFAGHPTLGSCHAWLEAGGHPRGEQVVQECGIGLVHMRREGDRLAFAAPPLRRSEALAPSELALVAQGLGIGREDIVDHAWCDNGPPWRGLLLRSAEVVLSLQPNASLLEGLFVGVIGARASSEPCAFEVRAFFPARQGITEDPVTGSLNAALAQWLTASGRAPAQYVAGQGTAVGRAGRVHVRRDPDGTVWIGGASVTCIDGRVWL